MIKRVAIEIATFSLFTHSYEFATEGYFHLATTKPMLSLLLPPKQTNSLPLVQNQQYVALRL